MPPKKQIPAPIDRPLSRAYLREFTGWSTAYPPGISDSTSLRIMENVMVNRDGSVRVRPGLKYLSIEDDPSGNLLGCTLPIVGTHEPFFLDDGTKAYLFAVRELDETVGFRCLARVDGHPPMTVRTLTEEGVNFTVPNGMADLRFGKGTTYVKYLQIDNKVFALSNANEPMRMFTVGKNKTAKTLSSIERPNWDATDKLTVVHPTQAWINGKLPTKTRYNRFKSPSMQEITAWNEGANTRMKKSDDFSQGAGAYSVAVTSRPERTNLMPRPLHDSGSISIAGWNDAGGVDSISKVGNALQAHMPKGDKHRRGYVQGPSMDATPLEQYRAAVDIVADSGMTEGGIRFRFYTPAGAQIGDPVDRNLNMTPGRKVVNNVTAPKGAATMRIYVWGQARETAVETFSFNNVLVCQNDEPTAMFSGTSGVNYFWTGTANASSSTYHPPKDVTISSTATDLTVRSWCASAYFRAGSVVRSCQMTSAWKSPTATISSTSGSVVSDAVGSWTRLMVSDTAPAATVKATVTLKVNAVPRGEWHYIDSALFEAGSSTDVFFSGGDTDTDTEKNNWEGEANNSVSRQRVFTTGPVPPAAAKSPDTLISEHGYDNDYRFAFFYTFANEIGESAASQVTVVHTQRGWTSWLWETANADSEPSGTGTNDPTLCADQLVAYMPQDCFQAARDQGATHWNLYMFTWSIQDPVPVMAVKVDEQPIEAGSGYVDNCWLRVTPVTTDTGDDPVPLPKASTRRNYSEPSHGTQGLVAADRMILVGDRDDPALIRWTSNQQGSYTDFSAVRGGGVKTLTSGNLYIAAVAKLWQNPQSVDTITILTLGVDGFSNSYYMAPAQIASQTEAVNIMGFEETTATPGTTSPYGVEVFNNALYHPLDEQLMKSTANNYNIAHKSITDQIQDSWRGISTKGRIVSAQHDARLYYLVYNPSGPPLEDDCFGNEVWVFDAAAGDNGTWSRWLASGHSLRKIEQGNRVYMSLVAPTGIYYFDDLYASDDVVDPTTKVISQRAIPWKMETNTQGANRAHDAWAHLQQANVWLGYFQGQMRYGIRSFDLNGKPVEVSKIVRDTNDPDLLLSYDIEDFLLVRRDLREWFFFAESVTDEAGVVQPSFGQVSLVQYRYTPVSVNVGYEYGSVETFEYGRAHLPELDRTTVNGVPMPYIDTRRP